MESSKRKEKRRALGLRRAADETYTQVQRTEPGYIQLPGALVEPAGLAVDHTISAADFDVLGVNLFALNDRIQLLIGDYLVAAEDLKYGDITVMAYNFGFEPKTFRNWKNICNMVKLSLRRDVLREHPGAKPLTLSHYSLVTKFDDDEQYRLLSMAIQNEWSVSDFRKYLKPTHQKAVTHRPYRFKAKFETQITAISDDIQSVEDPEDIATAYEVASDLARHFAAIATTLQKRLKED